MQVIVMKNTIAIISGVITSFAVAAILWPLVNMAFDNNFQLQFFAQPPAATWQENMTELFAFLGWAFISCFAGGFVCTRIAASREFIDLLIALITAAAVILIISGNEILQARAVHVIAFSLAITIGAFTGGFLGVRSKKSRQRL